MPAPWKISTFFKKTDAQIHPTATVTKSTLNGKITVGACSIVKKSSINGDITIGDHTAIMHSQISGEVDIGRYTSFNGPGSDITARLHKVTVGNFCSVARNCTIQEFNHITDRCSTYYIHRNLIDAADRQGYIWQGPEDEDIESRGPVSIGNDVWIGAQSVILSGVTIGNGAVISANSTVTRDIPPFAIAAGSPAKVIRYRFDEAIIERLENIEWWHWDDEAIRRNAVLFSGPLTLEKLESIRPADSA